MAVRQFVNGLPDKVASLLSFEQFLDRLPGNRPIDLMAVAEETGQQMGRTAGAVRKLTARALVELGRQL